MNVIDSNDFSTYHSLQLSLNRRFRNGANIQAFYTWSKSLDTRSFDPALTLASAGTTQTAGNSPAAERGRFTGPGSGEQGNVGRDFFRGDRVLNLDLSIAKKTPLSERVTLELRADFTNFTNSPSFGFPTTTITSATFGRIRDTVVSSSRQTMLAAKISF